MTHPVLSRIPILGAFVDERFLDHRTRSTSMAAIFGALVAGCLFEYRLIAQHVFNWDLFVVIAVMATIKLAMMIWYRLND
jgi:hypothetical protein